MQSTFLQVTQPEMIFLESMLKLYKNVEMAAKLQKKIKILYKHDTHSTPGQIIIRVCKLRDVTPDEIRSKKRDRKLSDTRACICRIIKDYFPEISLTDIGRYINVGHSSVIHYLNEVRDVRELSKMYLDLKLAL